MMNLAPHKKDCQESKYQLISRSPQKYFSYFISIVWNKNEKKKERKKESTFYLYARATRIPFLNFDSNIPFSIFFFFFVLLLEPLLPTMS